MFSLIPALRSTEPGSRRPFQAACLYGVRAARSPGATSEQQNKPKSIVFSFLQPDLCPPSLRSQMVFWPLNCSPAEQDDYTNICIHPVLLLRDPPRPHIPIEQRWRCAHILLLPSAALRPCTAPSHQLHGFQNTTLDPNPLFRATSTPPLLLLCPVCSS